MSNVIEAPAPNDTVVWLGTLNHFYLSDIRAIPENLLTVCPGGVARTPSSITAEVIELCDWCAATLRGETAPHGGEDAVKKKAASLTTHDAICTAMTDCTTRLGDAISKADSATFAKIVTPPWQMDASLGMITQIVVSHIWYHDGQLNYIQSLNGDEKMHWAD